MSLSIHNHLNLRVLIKRFQKEIYVYCIGLSLFFALVKYRLRRGKVKGGGDGEDERCKSQTVFAC